METNANKSGLGCCKLTLAMYLTIFVISLMGKVSVHAQVDGSTEEDFNSYEHESEPGFEGEGQEGSENYEGDPEYVEPPRVGISHSASGRSSIVRFKLISPEQEQQGLNPRLQSAKKYRLVRRLPAQRRPIVRKGTQKSVRSTPGTSRLPSTR